MLVSNRILACLFGGEVMLSLKKIRKFKKHDLILCTHWKSGDPRDPWLIGYFSHLELSYDGNNFYHHYFHLHDVYGNPIQRSFSNAIKITEDQKNFLLTHREEIELSDKSLFWWLKQAP